MKILRKKDSESNSSDRWKELKNKLKSNAKTGLSSLKKDLHDIGNDFMRNDFKKTNYVEYND